MIIGTASSSFFVRRNIVFPRKLIVYEKKTNYCETVDVIELNDSATGQSYQVYLLQPRSLARAFRYSSFNCSVSWADCSLFGLFFWARSMITFPSSPCSDVQSLLISFWAAMTWRSFCFSKALCSSVFWFRTFLPLKRDERSVTEDGHAARKKSTYIFWLNSSSLCKFWRSDDSKTGFLNFLGRTRPSSSRAMFDEIISAFMLSLCSDKSSSASGEEKHRKFSCELLRV